MAKYGKVYTEVKVLLVSFLQATKESHTLKGLSIKFDADIKKSHIHEIACDLWDKSILTKVKVGVAGKGYIAPYASEDFNGLLSQERTYDAMNMVEYDDDGFSDAEFEKKILWHAAKAKFNQCMKVRVGKKELRKRGIRIHQPWWDDKGNSFADWAVKNGFFEGCEVHRKNSTKNYEPKNIVFLTAAEHKKIHGETSEYLGVSIAPKERFKAVFQYKGFNVRLGYYDNALQAAMAVDKYTVKRGMDGRKELNFPHLF